VTARRRRHLPGFLVRLDESGHPLPEFVKQELVGLCEKPTLTRQDLPMRPYFALLLVLTLACGPAPGDTAGDGSSSGTGDSTGGEPTDGLDAPTWRLEPGGCGGLYGLVILPDGDLVVAGDLEVDGTTRPWAARYSAAGDELWSVTLGELPPAAGFLALDRVDDDLIAVGYHGTDGPSEPLLVRLAAIDGAVLWTRTGEPAAGALLGAAWSPAHATLWTASGADGALLVPRYDGDGALLTTLEGPGGGYSIGFAAALAGPDDVISCGRSSALEGGQMWLGRFGFAGELQWSAKGPDPGVGAFADCWDLAVGPDLAATVAEAGYKGARISQYTADGALAWEFLEPNAAAQTVDIIGDDVLVAGWSASQEPAPPMMMGLRSHGSGDRHGWLRRFGPDGQGPVHTWLGITQFSPRDLKVHPTGGAVIVGQLLPPDACATPWLGRVAID
jgi:hypothetical protein